MSIQNILLVDDDDINLFVGEKVLTRANFKVAKANSGEKAVELSKAEKYDLILMDINMPGMDGIDTAKTIRSGVELNENTPIFALTAHDNQEAERISNEHDLNGYIPKPIQIEAIQEAINKL